MKFKFGVFVGLYLGLFLSTLTIAEDILEKKSLVNSLIIIGKEVPNDSYSNQLAGAYDIISRDELEYEHVDDTMELFSKVAGVSISRYNQGLINTDISIRGFAGDGLTPHAKTLIDGIPSNLHNGYSEMDQMFPMALDSIQIFKGTSDARYGLFNVAGNYNLISRQEIGIKEFELTLGSYNTVETQAYAGIQSGNLTHNYFLGYRENEGYREHTALKKYAYSGRWFYQFDSESRLGFIARLSGYDGDAAGYLTQQQADETPRYSAPHANQDGGEKNIDHYSIHYDNTLTDKWDFSVQAYFQTMERDRWVRFSEASQLTNRYGEQEQQGIIFTSNLSVNKNWMVKSGFDYQNEDVVEQRFLSIGQSRIRDTSDTGVFRDNQYDVESIGVFLVFENRLTNRFRWNAGVRIDTLDGDFTNRTSSRDMYDFGNIVQPKLNLFMDATDNILVFANYGRSFQHPFGAALYTGGDKNSRDVSINDGIEFGTKINSIDALDIRLSAWRQNATEEFVVVDGDPQNIGETKREGWDLGLNWQASEPLYLWLNYSKVTTEIVNGGDSQTNFTGNGLRSIPDFTASFGLTYHFNQTISGRIHVDSQGDAFINEANTGGKLGGYTLTGASVDYSTSWGNVNFQVNNIFDKEYEYVYDLGNETIHSPGEGQNASLSVKYIF